MLMCGEAGGFAGQTYNKKEHSGRPVNPIQVGAQLPCFIRVLITIKMDPKMVW